jgi:hypothetical protein
MARDPRPTPRAVVGIAETIAGRKPGQALQNVGHGDSGSLRTLTMGSARGLLGRWKARDQQQRGGAGIVRGGSGQKKPTCSLGRIEVERVPRSTASSVQPNQTDSTSSSTCGTNCHESPDFQSTASKTHCRGNPPKTLVTLRNEHHFSSTRSPDGAYVYLRHRHGFFGHRLRRIARNGVF